MIPGLAKVPMPVVAASAATAAAVHDGASLPRVLGALASSADPHSASAAAAAAAQCAPATAVAFWLGAESGWPNASPQELASRALSACDDAKAAVTLRARMRGLARLAWTAAQCSSARTSTAPELRWLGLPCGWPQQRQAAVLAADAATELLQSIAEACLDADPGAAMAAAEALRGVGRPPPRWQLAMPRSPAPIPDAMPARATRLLAFAVAAQGAHAATEKAALAIAKRALPTLPLQLARLPYLAGSQAVQLVQGAVAVLAAALRDGSTAGILARGAAAGGAGSTLHALRQAFRAATDTALVRPRQCGPGAVAGPNVDVPLHVYTSAWLHGIASTALRVARAGGPAREVAAMAQAWVQLCHSAGAVNMRLVVLRALSTDEQAVSGECADAAQASPAHGSSSQAWRCSAHSPLPGTCTGPGLAGDVRAAGLRSSAACASAAACAPRDVSAAHCSAAAAASAPSMASALDMALQQAWTCARAAGAAATSWLALEAAVHVLAWVPRAPATRSISKWTAGTLRAACEGGWADPAPRSVRNAAATLLACLSCVECSARDVGLHPAQSASRSLRSQSFLMEFDSSDDELASPGVGGAGAAASTPVSPSANTAATLANQLRAAIQRMSRAATRSHVIECVTALAGIGGQVRALPHQRESVSQVLAWGTAAVLDCMPLVWLPGNPIAPQVGRVRASSRRRSTGEGGTSLYSVDRHSMQAHMWRPLLQGATKKLAADWASAACQALQSVVRALGPATLADGWPCLARSSAWRQGQRTPMVHALPPVRAVTVMELVWSTRCLLADPHASGVQPTVVTSLCSGWTALQQQLVAAAAATSSHRDSAAWSSLTQAAQPAGGPPSQPGAMVVSLAAGLRQAGTPAVASARWAQLWEALQCVLGAAVQAAGMVVHAHAAAGDAPVPDAPELVQALLHRAVAPCATPAAPAWPHPATGVAALRELTGLHQAWHGVANFAAGWRSLAAAAWQGQPPGAEVMPALSVRAVQAAAQLASPAPELLHRAYGSAEMPTLELASLRRVVLGGRPAAARGGEVQGPVDVHALHAAGMHETSPAAAPAVHWVAVSSDNDPVHVHMSKPWLIRAEECAQSNAVAHSRHTVVWLARARNAMGTALSNVHVSAGLAVLDEQGAPLPILAATQVPVLLPEDLQSPAVWQRALQAAAAAGSLAHPWHPGASARWVLPAPFAPAAVQACALVAQVDARGRVPAVWKCVPEVVYFHCEKLAESGQAGEEEGDAQSAGAASSAHAEGEDAFPGAEAGQFGDGAQQDATGAAAEAAYIAPAFQSLGHGSAARLGSRLREPAAMADMPAVPQAWTGAWSTWGDVPTSSGAGGQQLAAPGLVWTGAGLAAGLKTLPGKATPVGSGTPTGAATLSPTKSFGTLRRGGSGGAGCSVARGAAYVTGSRPALSEEAEFADRLSYAAQAVDAAPPLGPGAPGPARANAAGGAIGSVQSGHSRDSGSATGSMSLSGSVSRVSESRAGSRHDGESRAASGSLGPGSVASRSTAMRPLDAGSTSVSVRTSSGVLGQGLSNTPGAAMGLVSGAPVLCARLTCASLTCCLTQPAAQLPGELYRALLVVG